MIGSSQRIGDAVDDLVEGHGLDAVGGPDLHSAQGRDVAARHLVLLDAQNDRQRLVLLVEDTDGPALERLLDAAHNVVAGDTGPARPSVIEQRLELRHALLPVGLLGYP